MSNGIMSRGQVSRSMKALHDAFDGIKEINERKGIYLSDEQIARRLKQSSVSVYLAIKGYERLQQEKSK